MKTKSLSVLAMSVLMITNAAAQVNRFPELVGRWDKLGAGAEIRIEADGSVFSQSGDFLLSGSAGRCIDAGANFCFEGRNQNGPWACAYHVAFLNGHQSIDLRTTAESYQRCPRGVFSRSN